MLPGALRISEVARVVEDFNQRFGEMEKVTTCLARAARVELLGGGGRSCLEELVWLVKCWMGIQGVSKEVKEIVPRALLALAWTADLFEPIGDFSDADEAFARDRVASLVKKVMELGWKRREYSLASKVLHLLLPHRVPIYDSYVREAVEAEGNWSDERVYRRIVYWEFIAVRRLNSESTAWIGDAEPRTALRALDKYLWWEFGGGQGNAHVSPDPWAAVRHLGLTPEKCL